MINDSLNCGTFMTLFIHRSVLIHPLYYYHLSVTCIWTWHRISLSHPEGMCVPLSVSELSTVDSQLLCAAVYSLWLSIAFRGSSTRLLPTESNLVHTRSSKGDAQVSLALVYGLYFTAVWEVYCRLCSHSTGLEWVSFPQRWAVMGKKCALGGRQHTFHNLWPTGEMKGSLMWRHKKQWFLIIEV